MFKFIVIVAVALASVSAIEIHQPAYLKAYAAPAILKTPVYAKTIEYDAPAQYDFSYAVHDEHTGDIKSQQESRKGDAVHGSYSLIDADGYKRTVEYTADDHNGFNAVVHREPTNVRIPVHKVIATPIHKYVSPVHYAAPQIKYAAPAVHYAAPAVHYAAPAVHYAAPAVHYAAPVAKFAAPVYHAPAHAAYGHDAAHVAFSSAASNYHY